MKKPPDVIHIEIPVKKQSPVYKWINLMEWAKINGDEYLYERAKEFVIKITSK